MALLSFSPACNPRVPIRAALALTLRSTPSVTEADHADKFPDSNPSAKIRSGSGVTGELVAVGGTNVLVGVSVAVEVEVAVGGSGVLDAVQVAVTVGVAVDAVVAVAVLVGGRGV
jgi:hypothetical protein